MLNKRNNVDGYLIKQRIIHNLDSFIEMTCEEEEEEEETFSDINNNS